MNDILEENKITEEIQDADDHEEEEITIKKRGRKKKYVPEKKKSEEVAFERPENAFRSILQDMGYKFGVDTITKIFFGGDTNDPKWLDGVLKRSKIPVNNRVMIITAYYGKTLDELGIKVEAGSDNNKLQLAQLASKDEDFDLHKMETKALEEEIKEEKLKNALTRFRKSRMEEEDYIKKVESKNVSNVTNRTVTRPILDSTGNFKKDEKGNLVYETIVEPIQSGSGSGSNDIFSMIAAMKAMGLLGDSSNKQKDDTVEAIRLLNNRIESMQKDNELRRKEEEFQRREDDYKRQLETHRSLIEQQKGEFNRRIQDLESERLRDLQEVKERFTSEIEHRDYLDKTVGEIEDRYKTQVDELKKQISNTQVSIEQTITSKASEAVTKMADKAGDLTKSIVEPMAGVLKDHYTTMIDTQRKMQGLAPMHSSIPESNDQDLMDFVGQPLHEQQVTQQPKTQPESSHQSPPQNNSLNQKLPESNQKLKDYNIDSDMTDTYKGGIQ